MSRSQRAVFRLPGVSLLIPFLLFVCVTPLANAGAAFWLALYVFPAVGLAYILLTRTVADAEVIRTAGLLGGRRIAWADLVGLEFHGPRWAVAVRTDGRRQRLPMVRPRDLPRLAQVSGGRLLLGRDAPPGPDAEQPDVVQPDVDRSTTQQPGGPESAPDGQRETDPGPPAPAGSDLDQSPQGAAGLPEPAATDEPAVAEPPAGAGTVGQVPARQRRP